jgi:hypothetical protein
MLPKAPPTRREREVGRRTTDARGCNSTRVENSNRAEGRIQLMRRGVAASLTASVRASQAGIVSFMPGTSGTRLPYRG